MVKIKRARIIIIFLSLLLLSFLYYHGIDVSILWYTYTKRNEQRYEISPRNVIVSRCVVQRVPFRPRRRLRGVPPFAPSPPTPSPPANCERRSLRTCRPSGPPRPVLPVLYARADRRRTRRFKARPRAAIAAAVTRVEPPTSRVSPAHVLYCYCCERVIPAWRRTYSGRFRDGPTSTARTFDLCPIFPQRETR